MQLAAAGHPRDVHTRVARLMRALGRSCHNGEMIFAGTLRSRVAVGALLAAAAAAGWAFREVRVTLPGRAAAPLAVLFLVVVWYAWSIRQRYERSLRDRVRLLDEAGAATVEGQPRPLPPGIDLTAYRVIQEALTNALKHAPGARAEVHVRYTDRHLRLEILNTGPSVLTGEAAPQTPRSAQTAGRGLLGLRERVAAFGG